MMRSVPSQSQARPKTVNNESSTGSSNKVSGQQQTPVGSLSESSSNGSVGTATSIAASQPSLHLPTPHLVGKEVCQECHQENFQLHSAHGHAHTFHVLDDSPDIIAKFAAKSFHAGEEFGTYEYQAEFGTIDAPEKLKKLKATLPAVFGDEPFPLQYALGSGHNAYTLLTLITEENGNTAALEHRTSWYAAQGGLNITPGHTNKHPANGLELFGSISRDEVMEKCIDCHTTSAEIVGEEIKNLIPSVIARSAMAREVNMFAWHGHKQHRRLIPLVKMTGIRKQKSNYAVIVTDSPKTLPRKSSESIPIF